MCCISACLISTAARRMCKPSPEIFPALLLYFYGGNFMNSCFRYSKLPLNIGGHIFGCRGGVEDFKYGYPILYSHQILESCCVKCN